MCERFKYKHINSVAELAIPTGKFYCYHCEIEAERKAEHDYQADPKRELGISNADFI